MNKKILEISIPIEQWDGGYINGEDAQCFVTCDCGETLSVSDYKIFECPKCHKGYITEFSCYRISSNIMNELTKKETDQNKCSHKILEDSENPYCYICGRFVSEHIEDFDQLDEDIKKERRDI